VPAIILKHSRHSVNLTRPDVPVTPESIARAQAARLAERAIYDELARADSHEEYEAISKAHAELYAQIQTYGGHRVIGWVLALARINGDLR